MQSSVDISAVRRALLSLLRTGLGSGGEFPGTPKWRPLYDLAFQQGVASIVFGPAKQAGMPEKLVKRWGADEEENELTFFIQQKTAADMGLLLAGEGIRTYVLKGYVVAECYPVPSQRGSCDFDCFLLPASGDGSDVWERGNSLVEGQGYSVSRGFYKNSTFTLPGLVVENHRFLTPFRGNKRLKKLEALLQGMLRADAGSDKVEGTELFRPPLMVSALFLVEHAFSHFLHEGLMLRHITDWMMFSRRHAADIDHTQFEAYIDEFGFRRFYDAFVHVGEYVMGERNYESLTDPERRMMDSVWQGLDLHDSVKGIGGKLNLVGNTLRAGWKYRLFSPISMIHALWIQVKGVLFDKTPSL